MTRPRLRARSALAGGLAAALIGLGSWLVLAPGTASAGTLSGTLYRSPNTQVARWVAANPTDSRMPTIRDRIASQPQAVWFTTYNPTEIQGQVSSYVGAAAAAGQIPQLVVYNIPKRDCGQFSSGGAPDHASYQTWVRNFAGGLGGATAIVLLETDALALQDCLTATERTDRNASIATAVRTIKAANPNARVYLDGGHSAWHPAAETAARLRAAGVTSADGFFTNVANFRTTSDEVAYGRNILAALGDARLHQVIDTSRNGNGPNGSEWCDPAGRRIGNWPTTNTGEATVDAFVWVKPPGEADGCAAAAGTFLPDRAFELAGQGGPGPTNPGPTSSPDPGPTGSPAPGPTGSPTPGPTGSSPPPVGAGACEVSYRVESEWNAGFVAAVTVTNRGSTALSPWTLAFRFPGNQQITSLWNGTHTQTGAQVTVRSAGHNGNIPPGGSQSFGFQASSSGANGPAAGFAVNGVAC
ncbi:MAG TPA: glycoside hydrolase family 6 protein [Pilimelia sp.]|nr:glycoside hydrolase family 6 protein [Pilimelia sp.]